MKNSTVIQYEFSTEVTLGCEGCVNRRTLKFPHNAAAVLLGVDTTGLPIKATQNTNVTISGDGHSVRQGSQQTMDLFVEPRCGDTCRFGERIVAVGDELIRHANGIK